MTTKHAFYLILVFAFSSCSNNSTEKNNAYDGAPQTQQANIQFEDSIRTYPTATLRPFYSTEIDSANAHYALFYRKPISETRSAMIYLVAYEKGEPLWLVHPAADFGSPYPYKGISTRTGNVYVNAKYENGVNGYTGRFINYKAVGIHETFTINGTLKYRTDYDKGTFYKYTPETHTLIEDTIFHKTLYSDSLENIQLNLETHKMVIY